MSGALLNFLLVPHLAFAVALNPTRFALIPRRCGCAPPGAMQLLQTLAHPPRAGSGAATAEPARRQSNGRSGRRPLSHLASPRCERERAMASSSGKPVCSTFAPNVWRPTLCRVCYCGLSEVSCCLVPESLHACARASPRATKGPIARPQRASAWEIAPLGERRPRRQGWDAGNPEARRPLPARVSPARSTADPSVAARGCEASWNQAATVAVCGR